MTQLRTEKTADLISKDWGSFSHIHTLVLTVPYHRKAYAALNPAQQTLYQKSVAVQP